MTPSPTRGRPTAGSQVGGTSAGAPQWAALLAIADQGRALSGQPALNSTQPAASDEHPVRKPGRLPRHHQRHEHRQPALFGRARLRLCHRHGLADRQPGCRLARWHVHGLVRQAGPDRADRRDGGDLVQPHGHRPELERGDGHRLHRHGPLHQQRRPGRPAGELSPSLRPTTATHTFTVTLKTAGSQSITATDTTTSAITGTLSGISVAPAAPTSLIASAVSSSQINLTWTASSGATGYLVQQSLSSSGWTQVGSTSTAAPPPSSRRA